MCIARFRRFRALMSRCVKRTNGLPRLHLAKLGLGRVPVHSSDQQLLSSLATLQECRAALFASGHQETGRLLSIAILDIRMKLNRICEAELGELCEAMLPGEPSVDPSRQSSERRPLLRVVK